MKLLHAGRVPGRWWYPAVRLGGKHQLGQRSTITDPQSGTWAERHGFWYRQHQDDGHTLVAHLREPDRAFAEMRRVLKPGGLVAVAENDNETWAISPAGSAMERLSRLFLRALSHNGGNRLLMRHVRGALLAVGFDGVEAHAGAEVWGTPEAVRALAAGMATIAQGPGFVGPVLEQGWASRAEVEALPADLLAWGEMPDAYLAVLKPGALGWKPQA